MCWNVMLGYCLWESKAYKFAKAFPFHSKEPQTFLLVKGPKIEWDDIFLYSFQLKTSFANDFLHWNGFWGRFAVRRCSCHNDGEWIFKRNMRKSCNLLNNSGWWRLRAECWRGNTNVTKSLACQTQNTPLNGLTIPSNNAGKARRRVNNSCTTHWKCIQMDVLIGLRLWLNELKTACCFPGKCKACKIDEVMSLQEEHFGFGTPTKKQNRKHSIQEWKMTTIIMCRIFTQANGLI